MLFSRFSLVIVIWISLTGAAFLHYSHAKFPHKDRNKGSGLNVSINETENYLPAFLSKNDTHTLFSNLGINITVCYDQNMCPDQKIKCFCDNLCVHYGDCCANAYSLFTYLKRASISSQANTSLSQSEVFARHSTCLMFHNVTLKYIQVVNMCPAGSSKDTTRKCVSENDTLFVSYITKDKPPTVFRNKYCAECHGLSLDGISSWNYSVLCPESDINDNIPEFNNFRLNDCTKYAWAPHPIKYLRYCFNARLEGCGRNAVRSIENAYYYDLCLLYLNPVTVENDEIKFRNSHCRLCFEINHSKFNTGDGCSTLPEPSNGPMGIVSGNIPSFGHSIINLNVLLTFDVKSNIWQKQKDGKSICPGVKFYNYDKGKCECLKGQKIEGDTCVQVLNGNVGVTPPILNGNLVGTFHSNLHHVTGSSVVDISTTVPMSHISQQSPLNNVILCAIQNLTDVDLNTKVTGNICSKIRSLRYFDMTNRSLFTELESSITGDYESCRFQLNLKEDTVLPYFIHDLKLFFRSFSQVHAYVYLHNFANISDIACSGDQTKTIAKNVSLFTANGTFVVGLSDINDNVDLTDTKFDMRFSADMEAPVLETVIYCSYDTQDIPRMLNCMKMTYKPDTYAYTEQNNSVFLVKEQRFLTELDRFVFIGNYLVVCVNQSNDGYPSYDAVIGWVSAGTISVSCLSLLCLISIHLAIKDLRNLHGKCILSFSISLLIAQLGFLLNAILLHKFDLACKVSAIVDHYAWLCTFAWNGVMAYDVARRFSVFSSLESKLDDGTDSYRFLRYSLFSWIIPFVYIGVMNGIDQIHRGDFLGYGGGHVCWITNEIGKIISFAVPLIIMLLFAIICFSIVMHGIEYSTRVGIILRRKTRSDRNRCIIYTKISIFLGLTWIFGYIETMTKLQFFDYLNVIVNGLQGFILLISILIHSRLTLCGKKKESNVGSNLGTISSRI